MASSSPPDSSTNENFVPETSSLDAIYPQDALFQQETRWKALLHKFESTYGQQVDFVSRSPGRVNIIGEHVDYSLYQVLPMAVTFDVLLAISSSPIDGQNSSEIRIANVESDKYAERTIVLPEDGEIEVDPAAHDWTNYFKAGLKGAIDHLRHSDSGFRSMNLNVMVHGTVPPGSGLSSSTAFVCASALGVLAANGVEFIDKKQLCQLTIVSERSVGVNSGGMDQVASVFSRSGSATYINFVPELSAEPIQFSASDTEMTFLIAQSYVASLKAVTAKENYNRRVLECSFAAVYLAKILGLSLPSDESPLKVSLRGLHNTYFEKRHGIEDNYNISLEDFQAQLTELISLTEKYFIQTEGYTVEEIAKVLQITPDDLRNRYMSKFPVHANKFKLRQRALHVYTEALRVSEFVTMISSTREATSGVKVLEELGQLMNEAQASCKDLYECSCPELDELCAIAKDAGAYGSRLSGAGWGGSSIHLVPKDKIGVIKQAWIANYYKPRWPGITEEKLCEAIVVSKPGSGSFLFKLTADNELFG